MYPTDIGIIKKYTAYNNIEPRKYRFVLPDDERAQSVSCTKINGIKSPTAKARAKVLISISLKACAVFKFESASNVWLRGWR